MRSVLIGQIEKARLTKGQLPIADFFCKNEERICFMTLNEVASELQVNDTAIMRFCRSIGFNGYKELQKELQNNLLRSISSGKEEKDLLERLGNNQQTRVQEEIVKRYLEVTVENLKQSLIKTEPDKYALAAELIAGAKRKYIVGFRGSSGTAASFVQGLRYILNDVVQITSGDTEAVEKIIDINEEDVIVMISYARYGKADKMVKEIAASKGAKLIVISDMPNSPITQNADVVLHTDVKSMSFFNSQIGAMFTIEVLMMYIVNDSREKMKLRLSELDAAIKELI